MKEATTQHLIWLKTVDFCWRLYVDTVSLKYFLTSSGQMISVVVIKSKKTYFTVAIIWFMWHEGHCTHQNLHLVAYVLCSSEDIYTLHTSKIFPCCRYFFFNEFDEHFLGDLNYIILFPLHLLLCKRASELLWNRWKSWTCSSQHPEGESRRCQGERRISVQLSYSFQDKWGNVLSVVLHRNWKVHLEPMLLVTWLWICYWLRKSIC